MLPLNYDRMWCIGTDVLPYMLRVLARGTPPSLPTPRSSINETRMGRTQVFEMVGPLTKYPTLLQLLFGGTTMAELANRISAASRDPTIDSILLYVDSPGGTARGTDELAAAIFAARQVKPVTVCVSDLAASGAYWAISQATKIYSNPTGWVGSIGVYSIIEDWSKAYSEAGVRVDVVKAGEMKGIGVEGTEFTAEQRAEIQRIVNTTHSQFIQTVARGRGIPPERVRGFADGRVYGAAEAKRLGLIDEIAYFDDLLQAPIQAEQDRVRAEQVREAQQAEKKKARLSKRRAKEGAEEEVKKEKEAFKRRHAEFPWH